MENTKQFGAKSLKPFQHGIIQYCHALMGLFQYVKDRHNVQWIMTSRVNQDHLENFFSQIRGLGATFDHPGPAELLNRIRLLTLSHSETTATFAIEKAPVLFLKEAEQDDHFVTIGVTANVPKAVEPEQEELFNLDVADQDEPDLNNNSSPSDSTEASDCSELGLMYFAGYLAHKFRSELRELGEPTARLNESELPSWLKCLSRGGLIHPTADFVQQIKSFEHYFYLLHGEGVSHDKNVVHKLSVILLEKFPGVNAKLVRKYAFVRTMFRIRYLNDKISDEKRAKRSRNQKKVVHFTS